MSVSARFYVQHIEPPPEGSSQGTVVNLGAVCRGAHNKEWASATPAGNVRMVIRNDLAAQQFEQGEEYEVVFRKVTRPVQGDKHPIALYRDHGWASCGTCGFSAQGQKEPNTPDEDLDWSNHEAYFERGENPFG